MQRTYKARQVYKPPIDTKELDEALKYALLFAPKTPNNIRYMNRLKSDSLSLELKIALLERFTTYKIKIVLNNVK